MRSRCCEGEPAAPCLRAAVEAARQVTAEGWTSRLEWASCARGADAPAAEGELGLGNPSWQRHAVLALHTSFRERVLLPALACLGSGRSRPPSLSVRSARWYVACGNSFGRSLHPCARPHARRNEAPPSAALAPHGPALWRGRPTRLWGRGRCIRGPPPRLPTHRPAAQAWFRR